MNFEEIKLIFEKMTDQSLTYRNGKDYTFATKNLMGYLYNKNDIIIKLDLTKNDSITYLARKFNREDLLPIIETATMSKDFQERDKAQKRLRNLLQPLYNKLKEVLYQEASEREKPVVSKNNLGDFIVEYRNSQTPGKPYMKFLSDKKNKKWYLISYHDHEKAASKKSYNDNRSFKFGSKETKQLIRKNIEIEKHLKEEFGYLLEQASDRMDILADKFYTKPEVAKMCIKQLDLSKYDRIIEPSAGSGSFSKQIPNCEAYDLYPEDDSIKKQDFLKFEAEKGNILVIGNPPFGKANDLTLKFINRAAKFARTIAFIVPSSCRKETFIDRLDPSIHVRRVVELPKKAFVINGKIPYDVNCCFMIFDVRKKQREKSVKHTTADFTFTNKQNGDFAIKRKGWKVGKVVPETSELSEKSKLYIKSNIDIEELKKRFNSLVYPEAGYVLGSDSISMNEIVRAYNKAYKGE